MKRCFLLINLVIITALNASAQHPAVTDISISGQHTCGQTDNITYTFSDDEGMNESGTTIQYFSADDDQGTNEIEITSGISGKSIAFSAAQRDKFIRVIVTPGDDANAVGTATTSNWFGPVLDSPPVIATIIITGNYTDNSTLSVSYSFSDFEGDSDVSAFQWYSASEIGGGDALAIDGATTSSYTLTPDEVGKYVAVKIIPKDTYGTLGALVSSPWAGPVTQTPPEASYLSVSGSIADSSVLTANYTFTDVGNTTNASIIQWYRATNGSGAGAVAITLATAKTYQLVGDDVGKFISFTVTPKNAYGITGTTQQSHWVGAITDIAPYVINVTVSGTFINKSILTGSYVYHDYEGDDESGSSYQWYSASDASGNGSSAINGANATTYTLTQNENGKYIAFRVSPRDDAGKTGDPILSDWKGPIDNAAPVATNIMLSGTYVIGEYITASFVYSDPENDTQGAHMYKWYKSTSVSGNSPIEVQNSESETYLIKSSDLGYYFKVYVTPVATTGTLSGTEVPSALWAGPVYNDAPVASNVTIDGTDLVCKILTGNYDYSDNENDPEATSTFRWLKASTPTGTKTAIAGATKITYEIIAADANSYLFFEVTPKATTGKLLGLAVTSTPTSLITNTLPGVTFSPASVTICDGTQTQISLAFTGTPPFQLTYSDSVTTHLINTSNTNYTLNVSTKGIYKGVSLTDNLSCPVTDLPSQTHILVNKLPVVQITNLLNAYSLKTPKFQLSGTPSGGVFSGDGVVLNSGKYYFDPSYAGVTNTPIPVIYKVTSTCNNSDTVMVTILDATASITGMRPQLKYCNFDAPFLITAAINSTTIIGTFSISGNVGLTDHKNNTATISPASLFAGNYIISFTYHDQVDFTLTNTITIETVNKAQIIGISTSTVCANNTPILISGYPSTGTFKGNGITTMNGKYYFDPSLAKTKINTITFTDSTNYGCKTFDSEVITIAPIPTVKFEVPDICWNGDSTKFINHSTPIDSINSWNWNFGDSQATVTDNTSVKYSPAHRYKTFGDFTISLTAKNILGCQNSIQTKIHLGDIPKANFTWDKECFDNTVKTLFTNSSTSTDNITSTLWTILDFNGSMNITTSNAQYSFTKPGDYSIELKVISLTGCADSLTKTVHLRPTFKITDSAYANDFENPKNLWSVEQDASNNFYWGQPEGSNIKTVYSGVSAYYTSFPVTKTNQQLIVSSPCIDFTDVKKPYLEVWVNYNNTLDQEGAVLQYASDSNNQWTNVGTPSSSLNWFTSSTIASTPGGQTNGWSGNSNGWLQARTNIDGLINQKNIKFRFVYGANTSTKKDGFAFDHFTIGQRLKTTILEQFTNFSSPLANEANAIVDTLINRSEANAISLQYHTSFPGADSLNTLNQMDPGSRILFYGSGIVPICYLDGGVQSNFIYDFTSRQPNLTDINLRTLKDVDFDISFASEKKENAIQGTVNIKALKLITNRLMSLQIAIAEDILVQSAGNTYTIHNVLKQLLPTAAGTSIHSDWTLNQSRPYDFSWSFSHVFNPEKLKVIAFLQDEQTHEIYQAATTDVTPLTDVQNTIEGNNLNVTLYPNPVSENATLQFSKPLQANYNLTLTNGQGIVVLSEKLQNNINAVNIPVSNLPSGLYIIRITQKTSTPQIYKLIVIH